MERIYKFTLGILCSSAAVFIWVETWRTLFNWPEYLMPIFRLIYSLSPMPFAVVGIVSFISLINFQWIINKIHKVATKEEKTV